METKNCQNCKNDFQIQAEDFSFYEKIKVPPPTFCRQCRFIRRMFWRNERALYKRACDLCTKSIISVYSADAVFPVYCRECWFSDKWDAASFGRDYDFSKPFFQQYGELLSVVPHLALWQRNVVDSDYANMSAECKNVYLSISVIQNSENVFYSKSVDKSSNIFDSYHVKESDGCYETIYGEKNYNTQFVLLSRNCIDSQYLVDCTNCSNCFMSSNLRNKQFVFKNTQYSKEDYFTEIKKLNLGTRSARRELLQEYSDLRHAAIYRFANNYQTHDSTGNNIENVKNCKECFEIYGVENAKYNYRGFFNKDCMDNDYSGWSELMYEYTTGSKNDYNVKFSYSALESVRNADYTQSCASGTNLFGCISLRSKDNAILNKVYSKEEYEVLREKIITHMTEMPFIDTNGARYEYGEFFPIALGPFAYNETPAHEFLPLIKEQAIERGYTWKDPEEKVFAVTIETNTLPETIEEVDEHILQEIIRCSHNLHCTHQCSGAFRLTPDEFRLYKKMNIPIPDICSNCRYFERFAEIPPPKLWSRSCTCIESGHGHTQTCSNTFETSYAPNRPEKVYCEQCYQKAVL